MEADRSGPSTPNLSLVESVRCLECGSVYAKPAGGGTVRSNPGCPDCGYVGWVAVSVPGAGGAAQSRFFASRLRRPSVQSG
jgi:hypothetical protein